jgi:hypothetical protein
MSPVPAWRARPLALAALVMLLAGSLMGSHGPIVSEARADTRRPAPPVDLLHILHVITGLNAKPPKVTVVYLLGGSSARESTINDTNWAVQVRRLGGPRVRTYNFGANDETYAQDSRIVGKLPAVPSIVLIGVSLGRYMQQAPVGVATRGGDQPTTSLGPWLDARLSARGYCQHHYSVKNILTDAQKKAYVRWWLADRYSIFKENVAGNEAELDQLIAACQAHGLHPVLLELPLNVQIVGHAFDKPLEVYRHSCRALAKKRGVPKIDFLSKVHLVNSDFYDLFHLVEPGRVKWQRRLSKTVISLLERYSMGSQ